MTYEKYQWAPGRAVIAELAMEYIGCRGWNKQKEALRALSAKVEEVRYLETYVMTGDILYDPLLGLYEVDKLERLFASAPPWTDEERAMFPDGIHDQYFASKNRMANMTAEEYDELMKDAEALDEHRS